MRNIREILRQKWSLNRSHREVAASLNISIGGVSKIVSKADEAALTWDVVLTLTDDELERVVYGTQKAPSATRTTPDFPYLHAERKRPGVTLALLHVEYLERCPDGYRYTQFCELYRVVDEGLVARAVVQPHRQAMAEHYGTTVMPARPGKPRDKAKVENGVLIVQRWILARVRNEIFYSLDELNCRVDVLQEDLKREDEIERIHGVILVSLPVAVVDPQVPPEHAVKNRRTIAVHRVEDSLADGPCRGDYAVQFKI